MRLIIASTIRPVGALGGVNVSQVHETLLRQISQWFHRIHQNDSLQRQQVISHFLSKLVDHNPAPVFMSFNWDYELDRALFGTKSESAKLHKAHYGLGPHREGDLAVLKPHGSLNWFREKYGQHIERTRRITLWPGRANHESMYCFLRWREPLSKVGREYVPYIVPPTLWKRFDHPMMQRVWKRAVEALSTTSAVYFLGYSLPAADWHARYIFRCGFYNRQQTQVLSKSGRPGGGSDRVSVTVVDPDIAAFQRISAVTIVRCATGTTVMAKVKWRSPRSSRSSTSATRRR